MTAKDLIATQHEPKKQ